MACGGVSVSGARGRGFDTYLRRVVPLSGLSGLFFIKSLAAVYRLPADSQLMIGLRQTDHQKQSADRNKYNWLVIIFESPDYISAKNKGQIG